MFSNSRFKAFLRYDSFTFHKRNNYCTVTYEGHAHEHDPGIAIMRMHKKRSIFQYEGHTRMTLIGYGTNCPKQTAHAAFEKRSLMLSRERCTKKNAGERSQTLVNTGERFQKPPNTY